MSISQISAASSAAYYQQLENTAQTGAGAQTSVAQAVAVPLGAAAPPAGSSPSTGEVHHHHHRGGDDAASQSADLTQSGTAATGGSNILNTLV